MYVPKTIYVTFQNQTQIFFFPCIYIVGFLSFSLPALLFVFLSLFYGQFVLFFESLSKGDSSVYDNA